VVCKYICLCVYVCICIYSFCGKIYSKRQTTDFQIYFWSIVYVQVESCLILRLKQKFNQPRMYSIFSVVHDHC